MFLISKSIHTAHYMYAADLVAQSDGLEDSCPDSYLRCDASSQCCLTMKGEKGSRGDEGKQGKKGDQGR